MLVSDVRQRRVAFLNVPFVEMLDNWGDLGCRVTERRVERENRITNLRCYCGAKVYVKHYFRLILQPFSNVIMPLALS